MRRPPRITAATAIITLLALPGAGVASWSAGEQLSGVVQPTVGLGVDGDGQFTGSGGTQPATVTREQRGGTLVVTVTPTF